MATNNLFQTGNLMVVSIYANLRYFVLAELLLGWGVRGQGMGGKVGSKGRLR